MSLQSVCGEHELILCKGKSDESGVQIRYPYQKQWMCSPHIGLKISLWFVLHTIRILRWFYGFL